MTRRRERLNAHGRPRPGIDRVSALALGWVVAASAAGGLAGRAGRVGWTTAAALAAFTTFAARPHILGVLVMSNASLKRTGVTATLSWLYCSLDRRSYVVIGGAQGNESRSRGTPVATQTSWPTSSPVTVAQLRHVGARPRADLGGRLRPFLSTGDTHSMASERALAPRAGPPASTAQRLLGESLASTSREVFRRREQSRLQRSTVPQADHPGLARCKRAIAPSPGSRSNARSSQGRTGPRLFNGLDSSPISAHSRSSASAGVRSECSTSMVQRRHTASRSTMHSVPSPLANRSDIGTSKKGSVPYLAPKCSSIRSITSRLV